MRSLFILLVIINVSYLLWGVVFSDEPVIDVPKQQITGKEALILLSERPGEIKTQVAVRAENPPTSIMKDDNDNTEDKQEQPSVSKSCFSLGPIIDDELLESIENKLEENGFKPTQKSITDTEPKSYWVYLSPSNTMEEAFDLADDLKFENIGDFFVIETGENKRAISLGLYSSFNRANRRKSQLVDLGFRAQIKTRYKEVTRYWLDIQQTSENLLEDELWQSSDKDIVLQKIARPCVDPLPEDV